MTDSLATSLSASDIKWPPSVRVPIERILEGQPSASTLVVGESPTAQFGLWRVTPGAFSTDHSDYVEYIHITEGSGRLISQSGAITELSPGVTVMLAEGWKGQWVIEKTLTKVFTILRN
ncbi:cupin domain-containing protein [Pseudoclavibacter terrae]|uniref:DUF861 domain-containing protein n=1 Tax=Pseudoclavibacter terrae TaxID=1530195 RepID=A0A7J5AXI9_9MICO|nr:cupin domain-containing protein [Pseudoclavibacter terrae]KAB1636095.1 DUF861 domain-containing protein [Pseudoclavibacter terrae]